MSHSHPRELHPFVFAITPVLQLGITLAITAIGTLMGRDGMRLLDIQFSNVPQQKCLDVSVASTAITTGAMSLCLMIFSHLFSSNRPAARYKEAVNNSFLIAGAAAPQSFLSPFLGAYLLYQMSLQEAAFVATVTALGTIPIVLSLFILFTLAHRAQESCGNNNVIIERPEMLTQGTQTDTNAARKETRVVEIAPRENSDESIGFSNPLSESRPPARRICFVDERQAHIRKRSMGSSTDLDAPTHHRGNSNSDSHLCFRESP